ncbi:alpha-amylase family protein [Mariniluteicoccus endophyticus]
MSTEWTDHAIFWHVFPLGFTGAQAAGDEGHRFGHMGAWLDHAVELGASGLLLGPVFASESHGYDTTDHLRIDPRLGDDADFDAFVAEAKGRGLRIVLDGVFNHVGRSFGHEDWWKRSPEGHPWCFEGHDALVELDHANPEVHAYVADVMRHWLRRGVDGWRLDAAYATPAEFWTHVLPPVREEFPDAWFVGEVIHGDYPGIVQASTMDSVTDYELWKATWSSITDKNLFELDWALQRHNSFLDTFVPLTFVGNHDVTRIATKVGADGAVVATTVLMTVGGVPSVYYGDEYAYAGEKYERVGGDDEVRPLMPATPDEVALGHEMLRTHQELIGIRRRNPWLVRARTEKLALTNTEMTYACHGPAGERLEVAISLDPVSVVVRDGSGELFRR